MDIMIFILRKNLVEAESTALNIFWLANQNLEVKMAKTTMTKGGGKSAPRGGKGGVGFVPSRPGGNKPSMTGNPSGLRRGNLPPKSN